MRFGRFNPRQPRDRLGRWVSGSASRTTSVAVVRRGSNTPIGRGSFKAQVGGVGIGRPGYAVGKGFLHTAKDWTGPAPKRPNKLKKPAGRGPGVVPYARISPRSITGGVNAGAPVPGKKLRISVGAYVRVERTTQTALEKKIKKGYNDKIEAISPHPIATPFIKGAIAKGVNKTIGGQVRVKGASARLGTSKSGNPSLIIQRGSSRTSKKARANGISRFNRQVAAGRKVKTPRPQRRGK